LSTPGEVDAAGNEGEQILCFVCALYLGPLNNTESALTYLTNKSINGLIAQQQGGATIVLEHRYYGFSNPFPNLTVSSLKYHTIQQAIDDLDYFARNVKLAMPGGDRVSPDKAPWVLIGGSYSG
jgi:Serine carboxypeptidase S28